MIASLNFHKNVYLLYKYNYKYTFTVIQLSTSSEQETQNCAERILLWESNKHYKLENKSQTKYKYTTSSQSI